MLTEVARLYNAAWSAGVTPAKWREHRMVLHYKGKCTDPHCLYNYRGLGIDVLLQKGLSLIMLDRLEPFITSTKGLSLAQGGFQRLRGCPEQIFTLIETVRASIRAGKQVCAAFVKAHTIPLGVGGWGMGVGVEPHRNSSGS